MSDNNQTQGSADAKPAKPRRRFRILLGVSLALNLLVIGAVVGAAFNGPPSRDRAPGVREISAPYVGAFDRTTKREMRGEMRKRLPARSDSIAANKADYARFLALVRAETFDAAQAGAIMEGQLARAANFQRIGRELSIEKISAMSLQERNAYADRVEGWLERKSKRPPRKDKKER